MRLHPEHRSRKAALVALALGAAHCGVGDPAESTDASSSEQPLSLAADPGAEAASANEEYRHPLRALAEEEGPLPLFEALDDRDGKRYAVFVGGGVAGPGEPLKRAPSLLRLTRGKPGATEIGERAERPAPPKKITGELERLAAGLPGKQLVTVEIDVASADPGLEVLVERAIAEGRVTTRSEYKAVRARLSREREAIVARTLAPVREAVVAAGGRVTSQCVHMYCMSAEVPAGAVLELGRRGDVVGLDIPREVVDAYVNGVDIRKGAQIAQFFDAVNPGDAASYDGNGLDEVSESDNVTFAVLETGGYAAHAGFTEGSGSTASRINGRYECDATSCTSVSSFSTISSHATGVAGTLFGDLTDGQGSFAAADRLPTSGYAPEARGHLFSFSGSAGAVLATDAAAALDPDVMSNSYGYYDSVACSGASSLARAANRAYKDGVAVFAAAHNNFGSATECKVTAPGSAIGAFAVGAHMENDDHPTADTAYIRTAPIRSSSSWGGNATQGQNRSIVSITGPGNRLGQFRTDGTVGGEPVRATSLATPTVASAAMSFIDFYHDRWDSSIDSPGALYAHMLLMGDRQGQSGKLSGSLDHRWGSGRLRMRMLGNGQLDAPWYYGHGSTCISDGEIVDLPVAEGGVLPEAMDTFKAGFYWYDERHDATGQVANVNVYLQTSDTSINLATDIDAHDNKARLYYGNLGGKEARIRIYGNDVSGHVDPVCGSNAIRVFFAYFAEDPTHDTLPYNTTTGEGIYPESL